MQEIVDFDKHFFDIKKHKPQKGQVLAVFNAIAEFTDGFPKDQIVSLLLHNPKGAELAVKVVHNLCHAVERDAIKVCLAMATDLASGMTEQEVIAKHYEFELKIYYWTNEEYVPQDDPRWYTIKILNSLVEKTMPAAT